MLECNKLSAVCNAFLLIHLSYCGAGCSQDAKVRADSVSDQKSRPGSHRSHKDLLMAGIYYMVDGGKATALILVTVLPTRSAAERCESMQPEMLRRKTAFNISVLLMGLSFNDLNDYLCVCNFHNCVKPCVFKSVAGRSVQVKTTQRSKLKCRQITDRYW